MNKLYFFFSIAICFIFTSCSNNQRYIDYAINGNYEELKKAIEDGLDTNLQSKYGSSLLLCAAIHNHKNIVTLLLENKADINLSDEIARTPLMAVGVAGKDDMASYLIKRGADVKLKDRFGKTAMMYGVRPENADKIIAILLENGVNINSIDKMGQSALFWAVQENNDTAIKFLIAQGADVNIISNFGDNALMYYLSGDEPKKKEIVELFIKAGIDLKAQSKNKETVLDMALANGDEEIVTLIQNSLEKRNAGGANK